MAEVSFFCIQTTRFKLPFRPATHYDKSPNQVLGPVDPDPLLTGLPLEMMRVTWNVAWHGGMDALVATLSGSQKKPGTEHE